MPPAAKRARNSGIDPSNILNLGGTSRSATQQKRDELQKEADDQLAADAAKLAAQRAASLAALPPAPVGHRGDRFLNIAFIRVGQGDCIIMSTPGGRVLLFDCGSDAKDGELDGNFRTRLQGIMADPKFLGGSNTIDALISTHPDTDHYNELINVLGKRYKINNWYFSALQHNYAAGNTSGKLMGLLALQSSAKKVVLNNDPKNGQPGSATLGEGAKAVDVPSVGADGIKEDRLDGQGAPNGQDGIRIVDEPSCKISILAADVHHPYAKDQSNTNNRGSIVTLIEIDRTGLPMPVRVPTTTGAPPDPVLVKAKVLLCGDATKSTEQFLINTSKDRLSELTVVQAGHHGSANTSSSQAFMDLVNPFEVVASAGNNVIKDHLPSENVIVGYQDKLLASKRPALNTNHETWFWVKDRLGGYSRQSGWTFQKVSTTGSPDSYHVQI